MDLKRNEIVHWLAAANVLINSAQETLMGVTLIPPASLGDSKPEQHITARDVLAFAEKCGEMASIAREFHMRIDPPKDHPELGEPWFDIFQLPFVYPLPEGHPALRKRGPDIHPQSFPPSLRFLEPTDLPGKAKIWQPKPVSL
jgi:hypothetical protein